MYICKNLNIDTNFNENRYIDTHKSLFNKPLFKIIK